MKDTINKGNDDIKLTQSELLAIGKKFRKIREGNRLTQKEIADEIGYTDKYISLVENGRRTPSLELIYWYSKKFQVPTDFFINTDNNSFKKENQNFSRILGLSDKFIEELTERQEKHYNLINVLNNIFDTGQGWKFLRCLEDFFITDGKNWADKDGTVTLVSDYLKENVSAKMVITGEDVDNLAEIRLIKTLKGIKHTLLKKKYSSTEIHLKKKNLWEMLELLQEDNDIENIINSPETSAAYQTIMEALLNPDE